MILADTKTCTKCCREKSLVDFSRMARSRDGRRPSCKECQRAQQAAYQVLHRDRYVSTSARHYAENCEARKASQREYNAAHKEERRRYRQANLSKHAERQRLREAQVQHVFDEHVDRMTVFQRDEGVCGICNQEVSMDYFHVDHIIPLSKGGRHNYDNVQAAHPACNSAKRDKVDYVHPLVAQGT